MTLFVMLEAPDSGSLRVGRFQNSKLVIVKKSFHWRTSHGYEQRYTYNGYLDCICQGRVYTKNVRGDYYVCKERCGAKFMRRDKLDPYLDLMFARKLSSPSFLKRIARGRTKLSTNIDQIRKQIDALTAKRERVLDTYYEGMIMGTERDQKLAEIERERQVFSGLLLREEPAWQIDAEALAAQFKVFAQFDLLDREQKRRLLNAITPRIVVANYEVEGMFFSIGESHMGMDSSLQRSIMAHETECRRHETFVVLATESFIAP